MELKLNFRLAFIALTTILFTSTSIVQAQPPGTGWDKVFEDNFRGSSLDLNKWVVRTHVPYTTTNYTVGGDILKITSQFPNSGTPRGARIDSKTTFGGNNKYGYYEARIRINGSATGDIWPTWWLWGGNYRNGGPAPSATEIDIMEYSGFANRYFNNKATSSHHYFDKKKINGKSDITTSATNAANRNAFAWHVWGVLWTPTEITFYYDGQPYMSSDQPGDAAADTVPTRMILSCGPHSAGVSGYNKSAGGGQPDHPIPANAAMRGDNLAVFEIDWVRKWTGGTVPAPVGRDGYYDFGTAGSPLQSDYNRITHTTNSGKAKWTNTSGLQSRDRGVGPNNLNRDFVFGNAARTFQYTTSNGTYDVVVTLGDKSFAHNDMIIKAEGITVKSNIDRAANQFSNETFQVTVNDGKLDLEFSTTSGAWVVNRIVITPTSGGGNNGGGNPSSTASYDFGTGNSPVFSGYTRITQSSNNWTNTSGLASRDRGAGPNNLNRDFVFSAQAKTFEHNVPNGTYDVTVTFGDRDYVRTGQAVKAEGVTKSSNINTNANQFVNRSFQTTVSDGKLSLEFSTTGDVWCVNRVTINPASGGSLVAGSYDLGTGNSPLFSGYTRITPTSNNWTNTSTLASRDRGTGPNNLNRDFIFSANARTFEHTTGNGTYNVTVTFGDRDYARTGQAIKAEGQTVISGFNTSVNQFRNATFQTTVNDGKLSLEFSASTGVWCVTRIVINPVRASLVTNSKELKRDLAVKVFPNPTFDIIHVNADNIGSLRVRNLVGQAVLRNTKQSSIDIKSLDNGIYILEVLIEGTNQVILEKIVKQ